MRKNIQIAIPKPCHEDWNSFTPTSKGGFCSSCSKEVIDFSKMSDEQVKAYFTNQKSNTCGRFRKDQLKVYEYDRPQEGSWRWLCAAAVSAFLLLTSRLAEAQQHKTISGTEQIESQVLTGDTITVPSKIIIKGAVISSDEGGAVVPGVNVLLKGTVHGTTTDADGKFMLEIDNPGSDEILIFSFVGYKPAEYRVSRQSLQDIIIDMDFDATALGGAIVVGGAVTYKWYSPRGWWYKIKNLFH